MYEELLNAQNNDMNHIARMPTYSKVSKSSKFIRSLP